MSKQAKPWQLKIFAGYKNTEENLLFSREFVSVQDAYKFLHERLKRREMTSPIYFIEMWYQRKNLVTHWMIDQERTALMRNRKLSQR